MRARLSGATARQEGTKNYLQMSKYNIYIAEFPESFQEANICPASKLKNASQRKAYPLHEEAEVAWWRRRWSFDGGSYDRVDACNTEADFAFNVEELNASDAVEEGTILCLNSALFDEDLTDMFVCWLRRQVLYESSVIHVIDIVLRRQQLECVHAHKFLLVCREKKM